jgi:RNA polymerase sigma-70 factor (ECF subfamily)
MAEQLEKLYRRFGPVIYSRCRRILRDPTSAEDAAQEVFLRAARRLEQIPDDTQALKFLYRVSTNYCLNVLRDSRPQTRILDEWPDPRPENLEQALHNREMVRELLVHMPEKLRAPAVLYFIDDMEQKKVAEVLGITRRTVINRLNEFLKRARKVLARKGLVA